MQRYFIEKENFDYPSQQVVIRGDDVAHIMKVMRSSIGDQLITCTGEGDCFLSEILSMDKDQVICTLSQKLDDHAELPVHVTIAQGLPKGDKMDLIIQKGTELGASAFIPFSSSRTIVQLDEKKEQKRTQRWEKIAKEAAEQSHRTKVPLLDKVHSFKQMMTLAKQYDLALIAYENEQTTTIHEQLQRIAEGARILVIIGPEGGFCEQEINLAMENGIIPVMLGRRILRTETAGFYSLSCISYYFEQLGGR